MKTQAHKLTLSVTTLLIASASAFAVELPSDSSGTPPCTNGASDVSKWQTVKDAPEQSGPLADRLVNDLLPCLAALDPDLRDGLAYELLTSWLRGGHLSNQSRRKMLGELSEELDHDSVVPGPDENDSATLKRSFSALILAELMRSDLQQPFMTAVEREHLLLLTINALAAEDDFRGLDSDLGWIHPIAHLSDVLWRFALHDETTSRQALAILHAVRTKAVTDLNAYRYNESDRLARIANVITRRKLVSSSAIVEWLQTFSRPNELAKWTDAFASPQGMVELHNTKLFVRALSDQLLGAEIESSIRETLDQLVRTFTDLV